MNVNKNQSGTPIVIGIDHGYGNIKTASSCFRTSVKAYDTEPPFTSNMLVYNGRYYIIGEGHKEFIPEKQNDDDYFILTLAAIGRELYTRNLESASFYLAAGLPLTWVSEQKDEFKAYLLREPHVDFVFKKRTFHVDFVGADIFPQGFAAVAGQLGTFRGVNMICDIGNGTMNVMFITDCRPQSGNMFTEKFGTNQCMLNIREHKYNPDLMKLYVVGGEGDDENRLPIRDEPAASIAKRPAKSTSIINSSTKTNQSLPIRCDDF